MGIANLSNTPTRALRRWARRRCCCERGAVRWLLRYFRFRKVRSRAPQTAEEGSLGGQAVQGAVRDHHPIKPLLECKLRHVAKRERHALGRLSAKCAHPSACSSVKPRVEFEPMDAMAGGCERRDEPAIPRPELQHGRHPSALVQVVLHVRLRLRSSGASFAERERAHHD